MYSSQIVQHPQLPGVLLLSQKNCRPFLRTVPVRWELPLPSYSSLSNTWLGLWDKVIASYFNTRRASLKGLYTRLAGVSAEIMSQLHPILCRALPTSCLPVPTLSPRKSFQLLLHRSPPKKLPVHLSFNNVHHTKHSLIVSLYLFPV